MKTALVIGATGGVGGAVAKALLARGWHVRGLTRNTRDAARRRSGLSVEWINGDAMRASDLVAAASGASLIVHGANPPGYRNWEGTVVQMLDASIAAARASDARILLPGTIYNYGPDAFPVLSEDAPQNPLTRKGKLRVVMEKRLEEAAKSGVRSVIVRAGDFFGAHTANNWFAEALVTPGKPVKRVIYPGAHKIGHSWAYLPDVAETMLRVVERENAFAPFERFHMRGHWFARGSDLVASIRRVVDRDVPVWRMPWFAIGALSPAIPMFREMYEMRYLWRVPIRLDNGRLEGLIGPEPHTPVDVAIRETLQGLHCLSPAPETRLPKGALPLIP